MKKIVFTFAGILLFGSPAFPQGFFKLCWYDEFDGTALDQTKWGYQTGAGEEGLVDWGNNEQQYYTAENAVVKDGLLVITAKKEQKENKSYTSARLLTRGKFHTTYGRIEARISSPKTDGMWPAFWMLPQNSPYGSWAASGEMDIMEAKGRIPDKYSGTIHYGGEWPGNAYFTTGEYVFPNNTTIEDYHVYALEWKADEIAWYCDGHLVGKQTQWGSEKAPYPAPFDVDFYILLNLAVGGNYDSGVTPPAGFTSAEMKIDYVRVYKWDDKLTQPELPPPSSDKEVESD
ncbi:MAG: glycoside hydrolase family 16 protein [Tannerella sp.]|jgi:beta-glucanase (GH16 family)|nr:glycoside hydrolase family 16 protein [Tannerella sp.]